ncbi:MAG: hypothetical protein ACJ763_18470 [Bdellovibrionia bacterium]
MIHLPVPKSRRKLIELDDDETLQLLKFDIQSGNFLCVSYTKPNRSKYSYFVSTDSKKFGPFDEFQLPSKPSNAPAEFFQYKQGSSWYFKVGDQEYGPFEELVLQYAVRDTSQGCVFAYAARAQAEEHVYFSGQKFGPYRNVFNLAINDASDRASWIAVQAKQWFSHDMDQILDQGPYDEPYGWNDGTTPPPSKWSHLNQKESSIAVEFFDSLTVPASLNQIQVDKASHEMTLGNQSCRFAIQGKIIFLFEY